MINKTLALILVSALILLSVGELAKHIKARYIRPPMPPAFQHEILEILWDNKDLKVASQICRDRVLEKFTLRNLARLWWYRFELRLYDKFK